MKTTVLYALLFSACLLLNPSAWASWSSFVSTGSTTGFGNPSCAFVSTGNVVCAVRSGKSLVMVNLFNGTKWGTWKSLPGAVASDANCTSDGAGKVICGATAANGNLQVTIFNGTAWSAPAKVTGALYSAPSCAEYTAGQVLCIARNAAGGLAWSLYNGTAWSAFANLTTSAVSAPSCTTDNNSAVICAVFTIGGATLVNRFAAGAWEGFLNIGGIAGGEPDCVSLNSGGKVACFARGYASGIYGSLFNGGSWVADDWSSYGGLSGTVNDNAGCTSQAAGLLLCGVIGVTDAAFYADVYTGSSWAGWAKIGGSGVGTPACAALGTGQVVC